MSFFSPQNDQKMAIKILAYDFEIVNNKITKNWNDIFVLSSLCYNFSYFGPKMWKLGGSSGENNDVLTSLWVFFPQNDQKMTVKISAYYFELLKNKKIKMMFLF